MNKIYENFARALREEHKITNESTIAWLAEYAHNHNLYESMQNGDSQGIFTTPMSTLGMGNPSLPGMNGGPGFTNAAFDKFGGFNGVAGAGIGSQSRGSGDIPVTGLSMAVEVAAQTIGFELLPVVPAKGPMMMLQYIDYPYGGGKLGRFNEHAMDGKEDKPLYIKISAGDAASWANIGVVHSNIAKLVGGSERTVANLTITVEGKTGYKFHGLYTGKSRIDGGIIVKVIKAHDDADKEISINEVFRSADAGQLKLNYCHKADNGNISREDLQSNLIPDLISAAADHIQGFSNFTNKPDAIDNLDPMTRGENETGTGNTIGARMFTKMIQMGSYEVTGSVSRQQLQDLPMYGIDVVGGVLESMQNELSQSINNRILDRVFKLGVENAVNQKRIQNLDLNLFFGASQNGEKELSKFSAASKFVGLDGLSKATADWKVKIATQNTAAENVMTHQRRLATRILVAANVIQNVSRFGRGNWAVLNTQLASALQDNSGFVLSPMSNTLVQDGSQGLYFSGTLAGVNIYVDPYMTFDDTRVCVGRKGSNENGKVTPGLVFVPYILCDTVSIVAEGTMATKLLCNSRFALAEVGFHPEQSYFTFMVEADGAYLI